MKPQSYPMVDLTCLYIEEILMPSLSLIGWMLVVQVPLQSKMDIFILWSENIVNIIMKLYSSTEIKINWKPPLLFNCWQITNYAEMFYKHASMP